MQEVAAFRSPVVKESLDRKAATLLRNAARSGELAPWARITEQAIASQLDLSRGTVRAALHRLAADGLLPSPQVAAAVHEPMVDAILDGDKARAEALLVEHSVVYGEKLIVDRG